MAETHDDINLRRVAWTEIVSWILLALCLGLMGISGFFFWSLSEIRNGPPAPNRGAGILVVTWLIMILLGLLLATSAMGLLLGVAGVAADPAQSTRLPVALASLLHLVILISTFVAFACLFWIVN